MNKGLFNSLKIFFVISLITLFFVGCRNNAIVSEISNDNIESVEQIEQVEDKKMYNIGLGQFVQHPSLDNGKEGFIEGLKEEGFIEGDNLTLNIQNADANGCNANLIYTNFSNKNMDMLVAIATPMAQSAYSINRESNIPIIYTAVTDPVAAGIANADKTSVGNITGTSDKLPIDGQLSLIHEMFPEAKKVGILYTTSEVNSVSSINEYKQRASEYDLEIVDKGINDTSEMPLVCDNLLSQVDVVTNVTDNTVVASLPVLLNKANEKNIPVLGSEIEQVKMGCIACLGLDYIELGKQTAKMAARVLRGESKASEMSYEVIENASLYLNEEVANNLNYTFDDTLLNEATEVFKEILN